METHSFNETGVVFRISPEDGLEDNQNTVTAINSVGNATSHSIASVSEIVQSYLMWKRV